MGILQADVFQIRSSEQGAIGHEGARCELPGGVTRIQCHESFNPFPLGDSLSGNSAFINVFD